MRFKIEAASAPLTLLEAAWVRAERHRMRVARRWFGGCLLAFGGILVLFAVAWVLEGVNAISDHPIPASVETPAWVGPSIGLWANGSVLGALVAHFARLPWPCPRCRDRLASSWVDCFTLVGKLPSACPTCGCPFAQADADACDAQP